MDTTLKWKNSPRVQKKKGDIRLGIIFRDLSKDEYYHFYSAGVGTGYGLEIVLDPEEDQYMSTIKPFVGFYESVFFQLYNDSRNVQQYISSRNVQLYISSGNDKNSFVSFIFRS